MATKYPGRDFITTPEAVAQRKWEAMLPRDANREAFACEHPVPRHGISLPDPIVGGRKRTVEVHARCRKCPSCLSHRRRLWTARAIDEVAAAPRTWFGTLTVSPEHRWRYRLAADLLEHEAISSEDHAELVFRCMADLVGKEVTKMFKRLRESGAQFRYLLVAEAHKDGFPHYHLLLHEVEAPIRKAALEPQWRLGFSQWRLVGQEPGAARYVCKYLNKTLLCRVRGSQRYGRGYRIAASANRLNEVADALKSFDPETNKTKANGELSPSREQKK